MRQIIAIENELENRNIWFNIADYDGIYVIHLERDYEIDITRNKIELKCLRNCGDHIRAEIYARNFDEVMAWICRH